MSKAIILMGGPSRGTRFRPLSLDIPKTLFPIAGIPLVEHHIIACKKLQDLKEILLLGFYKEEEMKDFVEYIIKKHNVKISYLNEVTRSGTAGGLYVFRERILEGNPEFIFILHSDIVCSFPLPEIREYHQKHGQFATIMATRVPKEHSVQFGCIISDDNNNVVHFAEKPTTFISDLINTGVYCFSKEIIEEIGKIYNKPQSSSEISTLYHSMDQFFIESANTPYVRLEQDVIFQHVGTGKLKTFIYNDFWRQIKNAGSAVYCNTLIINYYAKNDPSMITKDVNCKLVGNNVIDKTAVIDPSAKIGPNVFIGPNVKIGKGVRVKESIVLTNTEVKDNACIMYCIIGWDSVIGNWSRIEGIYNPAPSVSLVSSNDKREGITIFGKGARAKPEIIVYNCIVMPHKDLDRSYKNAILL